MLFDDFVLLRTLDINNLFRKDTTPSKLVSQRIDLGRKVKMIYPCIVLSVFGFRLTKTLTVTKD